MKDPQLSNIEQIPWVIPGSHGKYLAVARDLKAFPFVPKDDLANAFCMARETDAMTLYRLLLRSGWTWLREPERRVVLSHPQLPEKEETSA